MRDERKFGGRAQQKRPSADGKGMVLLIARGRPSETAKEQLAAVSAAG